MSGLERDIHGVDFELRKGWGFALKTEEYQSGSELERQAYDFVLEKHAGQKRRDGSDYTDHLVAVASLVREVMGIDDEQVLAAALLHDVVEDAGVSLEELEAKFGSEVAKLVGCVTELKGTGRTKRQEDIETTKRVVRESGLDPRVALIKLADRTHNMMTLEPMPQEKRIAKARETFEVYVPLAESLGVWEVKRKLEDLSVFYLYPEKMEEAKRRIDSDLRLRREFLYHWQTRLERMLVEMGVEGRVEWQVMGYWEAVKKRESMRARDFSQVQLVSFRVVLPSELDCRMASQYIRVSEDGLVDPQRADDYITEKTYNGYRAMHEGLRLKEGSTEVAFVTEEMEEFNAWGVVRGLRRGEDVSRYSLKLFFDTEGRVIKFLPEEATGVDLVVSIDPQLLHSVGSILVDDREFPLSINIPNAAVVRLVMKEGNGVDVGLFEYAMLPKTREKLEEIAKEIGATADLERGRGLLTSWMKSKGFDDLNDLVWGESERKKMRLVLMELGVRDIEELYLEMGLGNRAVEEVVRVFERSELEGVRSGLMKIRLAGRDERGIMAEVSGLISEFGGVIRLGKTEGDGQLYTFELVVAGVGSEAKLEIERRLSDDGHRYSDVTVV